MDDSPRAAAASSPEPGAAAPGAPASRSAPSVRPGGAAGADPRRAQGWVRRLGPAGPLALAAATLPALGGLLLLGLLNVVGPWLKAQGALGLGLYVLGFAVMAGLALLPTYAQAILGGWAFGFLLGYPAALGGFVGGAALGYLVGRRASGRRVLEIIDEHPKWRAIYEALVGRGFWRTLGIVALLRLPPNSPFAMTNLVMAATRVPLGAYLLGTLGGMAPRTGLAVYAAAGLRELTFDPAQAGRPAWLVGAGIVVTLGVVIVIGLLANRAVARVTGAAPLAEGQV